MEVQTDSKKWSIKITQLHNFVRFSNAIQDQSANILSNITLIILTEVSSKGQMKIGRKELSQTLASGKL